MISQLSDWQNIQIRLEKLEKENRRLKRVGLLVGLAVFSLVILGSTSFRNSIVEAKGLSIRDANGKRRVWIGQNGTGGVGINFIDSHGKISSSIGVNKDKKTGSEDAYLRLFDKNKAGRAILDITNKSNNPILIMKYKSGALILGELDDGTIKNSGIWFYDSDNKLRTNLGLKENGVPILSLGDGSRYKMHLSVAENGDPAIVLRDPNGKERAILAVYGYYGTPIFGLLDPHGQPLFMKP